MSFAPLGLSESLLQALSEQGYSNPTPIQKQAIPAVLAGRDLLAAAQTGTGKTAGFSLPLLHRLAGGEKVRSNGVRALILTPTRELAAQVGESVAQYGRHLPLTTAVVYGGVKINPQMMKLRRGTDVLVATPGRLLDLYRQNAVRFDQLETLVLDEADRMLDMGFIDDIREILTLLPKRRQSLLFSATLSGEIRALAKGFLQKPLEIDVSPRQTSAATVQQWLHPVDKKRKSALLGHLIHSRGWRQVLVFVSTRRGADRLVRELAGERVRAVAIHGDKSQAMRTRALEGFKQGKVGILVATDVAARGLDIDDLPLVVNFDLPRAPESYVHRIGRTGRAGAKGRAISLVSADEVVELRAIERLLKKRLTRDAINGFEPEHDIPESPSPTAPVKARKKPKKPKRSKLKAAAAAKAAKSKNGRIRPSRSAGEEFKEGKTPANAQKADKAKRQKPKGRNTGTKSPHAGSSKSGPGTARGRAGGRRGSVSQNPAGQS